MTGLWWERTKIVGAYLATFLISTSLPVALKVLLTQNFDTATEVMVFGFLAPVGLLVLGMLYGREALRAHVMALLVGGVVFAVFKLSFNASPTKDFVFSMHAGVLAAYVMAAYMRLHLLTLNYVNR